MGQDPIVRISADAHTALKRWALDNNVKMYEAAERAIWAFVQDKSTRTSTQVKASDPGAPQRAGQASQGIGEETIWGPVTRIDPDGTRWIATEMGGEVEEQILKLIPEGDLVWEPSIATARAKLAAAQPAVPAPPNSKDMEIAVADEDEDEWMGDFTAR